MNRSAASQFRRAGVELPPTTQPFSTRWYGGLILLLVGVLALTLSFAPVNQFYLAWVGLVPFLLVVGAAGSAFSAFLWGFVGGLLFFTANMWWMVYVTPPGMAGLMVLLALYWGAAGVVIRPLIGRVNGKWKTENGKCEEEEGESGSSPSPHFPFSIFHFPLITILLISCVWVAIGEWFRGSWPWHGLPWLYLGHTQSPAIWICQIADITGVSGISFLVVACNAWIALWIRNRLNVRGLVGPGVVLVLAVGAVLGYGVFRVQHEKVVAGPEVLVVQPNYPQDNSGAKGATQQDLIDFHVGTTVQALKDLGDVDLIVWSETMMPALNPYARLFLRESWYGNMVERAHRTIGAIAFESQAAVLTGGAYYGAFDQKPDAIIPKDNANAAYFYDRTGILSDLIYKKIHLVPFGEFIPFRDTIPWLYRLMIHMGPKDMESYLLTPGQEDQLTVFPLSHDRGEWRFVTPICFEDIDADLCALMFRPTDARPDLKRADFIVNITNDGWFKANENAQHLQAAVFRSIENRVPSARAVNTGISGFIDPLGRTSGLLPVRTIGTSHAKLLLDHRVTFFTRHGLWFCWVCGAVTSLLALQMLIAWVVQKFAKKA